MKILFARISNNSDISYNTWRNTKAFLGHYLKTILGSWSQTGKQFLGELKIIYVIPHWTNKIFFFTQKA